MLLSDNALPTSFTNEFNKFASGSGSVPTPGSTYDQVTRQTALAAASAFAEHAKDRAPCPFVFVSAAEAGWDPDPPFVPPFLTDYLIAKVRANCSFWPTK